MALSSKADSSATAAPRVLLMRGRDKVLLAACLIGLLTAWILYAAFGVNGVGNASSEPVAASLPTAAAAATNPGAVALRPSPGPSAARPPASPKAAPQHTAPPRAQGPVASVPQRISYPAAQMDVAIHPLQPTPGEAASQSIVPPETMDGYWLAPFGTPGAGSTNTTYVVGHSWQGVEAPFNRLSTLARPGDTLTVQTATGAIAYKVDSVTTYVKAGLKDSPIWAVVPNRLVLISCYTGDLWGQNVAVVASPVTGS